MKKLFAAVAVGAALVSGVVTAGTASAAPASAQSVLASGSCAGYGYVRVNTSAVNVYTGAGTAFRVVKTVYRGDHVSCWPASGGDRYSLCGVVGATSWIPVDVTLDNRIDGYLPATCVTDV
ncbi:hypothetical protein [Kutzneria sp. NPDC052558]|uniref:hypothetical protein n=1 Tax=Kutzneria sp. NPDC052558 TaxID=3364121 RepID=UPI0037C9E25F